jgi:hypothetical protein
MWYSNLEKNIYFSTYPPPTLIHFSQHFTSASNPQHRSLLTVVSAISAPPFQPLSHQWNNVCHPNLNRFMRQTLPTVNKKYLWISFALSPFANNKKKYNRTLLFGNTLIKHGRHFDYWYQPLNMFLHVCYLECHEAGLFCYLVIHIENLLCPFQVFYFHLWPIYWLSFVLSTGSTLPL